jgi:hypothetical protein
MIALTLPSGGQSTEGHGPHSKGSKTLIRVQLLSTIVERGGAINMEYKAIKVPAIDYESIEKARQQLAIKGIGVLPKELREVNVCPICGSKMEGFSIEYQFLQCSNAKCGYKQRNLRVDAAGAFAIGAVVGLGIAALIYLLTKK